MQHEPAGRDIAPWAHTERLRGAGAIGSCRGEGSLYARSALGDPGDAAVAQWQSFSLPN